MIIHTIIKAAAICMYYMSTTIADSSAGLPSTPHTGQYSDSSACLHGTTYVVHRLAARQTRGNSREKHNRRKRGGKTKMVHDTRICSL